MKTLRLALLLTLGTVLFPCSPDTSPRFIPGYRPEQTDDRFAKGQLGILTPYLGKRYELVAWRYLSGLPLSAEEQAAVAAKLPTATYDNPGADWQKARGSQGFLIRSRSSRIAPNEFYDNCLDDAFHTAIATLADRQKTYANPALVSAWETAQDQVFSNCSGEKPTYPADPDASLPALARADRLYQIAAAHFYNEDLDGALARFKAIAADPASPWRQTAAYMEGRVLLRESVLLKKPQAADQAKAQLLKVAADPGAGRFQNAAQHLAETLNPQTLFASTGKQFAAPHPGPDFAGILDTASYLMETDRFKEAFAAPNLPEPFDWVRAFEAKDEAVCLRRWKETHSELWLIPALLNATAKDADTPALIEAANKVPESSPAYDTATYQALRLTIEAGKTTEARNHLDKLLAGKPRPLVSVDNAFRGQRLQLATSFEDFLHWAARKPIGYEEEDIWGDDKVDGSPVLGPDSIVILNQATPLARLIEAAESKELPAWPASEVARVALTRALVLNDDTAAARLAPAIAKAHPKWANDLKAYTSAAGPEKRFLATFLIERQSALATDLFSDFKPSADRDDYAEWWCANTKPDPTPTPTFLTAAERKEASTQLEHLIDAGPAQAVIAPVVMSWAKAHPDDPRNAEALGRLVRITRYGCRGIPDINGPISKAAFDLLHQKYPTSNWAKQTPYWFKD